MIGEMTVATAPERTEEFLRLLGDPKQAAGELARFARSAAALSSAHRDLMETYDGRWIALFDGEVLAVAETLDALLAQIEREHSAIRSHILVRHMQRDTKMLFV